MLDSLASTLFYLHQETPILNGALYLSPAERLAVDHLVGKDGGRSPSPSTIAANISYRIDSVLDRAQPKATLHRTFGLWVVVLPIGESSDELASLSGGYVIDLIDSRLVGKARDL